MSKTEVMIVAVAGNAYKRLECSDIFGKLKPASKISGMPYLVNGSKDVAERLVENTVRN